MDNLLIKVLSEVIEESEESAEVGFGNIKEPLSEGDLLYLLDYLQGVRDYTVGPTQQGISIKDKKGKEISFIDRTLIPKWNDLNGKKGLMWKLAGEVK